jgi:hypothetical protein
LLRNIVNVGYNVQASSNSKHKMLTEFDTGSVNDSQALAEMGLMFIGYNLGRCISVIGAEKLIRALRECCLPGILKVFSLVLRHIKQLPEKYKNTDGINMHKINALYGCLLNPYEVSLIGK